MTFSRRLIIGSLVLTSVLIVMVFAVLLFQQRRHVDNLVDEGFSISARELSTAISMDLKIRNVHGIQGVIGKSYLVKKAAFLTVADESGAVLYANPNPDQKYGPSTCAFIYREIPVLYDLNKIGSLSYCFDPRALSSPSADIALIVIVTLSLVGWSVLLIYWLRLSTRRIGRFVKTLEKIDPENPVVPGVPVQDANDTAITLLYDRVADLLERLNAASAAEQKRKKDAALAEISRSVAHDIRSPLSALLLATQTDTAMDPQRKKIVEMAIERIKEIASELLKKSRDIEVGPRMEMVDDVEFLELVAIIVEEKRSNLPTGISISLNGDKLAACKLNLNPSDFKRTLSNIINNSVEALRDRGSIAIKIESVLTGIAISVTDNGPGIPSNIIPKLTEKNFTYGKKSGSGLGLYFANELAKNHAGNLEIDSEEGIGTTIKIFLPTLGPVTNSLNPRTI